MTRASQCLLCKHFDRKAALSGEKTCKAFDIIPHDIYMNRVKHDKKYSGQENDILFKLADKNKPFP